MENERKIRLLKILFISLITFSSLLFSINYVIQQNLDKILKNLSKYPITIGKVESLIFPFYIKTKDVSIEIDKALFKSDSLLVRFYPLRYFSGKNYLDIEINNLNGNIPQYFWDQPFHDIDLSKIKSLKISSLSLNNEYSGMHMSFKTNSIQYKTNGEFTIPYLSGEFLKEEIKDKFIGRVKLFYTKKTLKIDYLDIKGDDFFLQFTKSEKILNSDKIRSHFEGFIDEKFVKLIDPQLKGRLNFNGELVDKKINSKIYGRFFYNKNNIDLSLNLDGSLNEKISFRSNKIIFDNNKIFTEGFFDIKDKKGNLLIKFPEDYKIYADDKWDVKLNSISLKNASKNSGNIEIILKSKENYTIRSEYEKKDEVIRLKNLSVKSPTLQGSGDGDTDLNSIHLNLKAEIKDNPDIKESIKNSFYGTLNTKILLSKEKIEISGQYQSGTTQKLYGILTNSTKGDFILKNDNISFYNISKLTNGSLELKGFIDFTDKNEQYLITAKSIPFKEIMHFFDTESDINYNISGKSTIFYAKGDYFGDANFKIDNFEIPQNTIGISFKNSILKIERLSLENNILKPNLILNFKDNIINGKLTSEKLAISRYPEIRNLDLKMHGEIGNPQYDGSAFFSIKNLENKQFKIKGDLKTLTLSHNSNNLTITAKTDLKKSSIIADINLKNYFHKNTVINGLFSINSDDLKNFSLTSKNEILVRFNTEPIKINSLNLLFTPDTVTSGNIICSTKHIENILIKIKKSTFDNLTGDIDFKNSKLHLDHIDLKKLEGVISFDYDFKNLPYFYGNIKTSFDLSYPDIGLKLKNIQSDINFNREQISLIFKSKDLSVAISASKYADERSYYGNLSFKNIFISKRGFYGSFSGNIEYSSETKSISGDIYIDKGVFRYSKYERSYDPPKKYSLPFKLDLKISSSSPIKITDGMINGLANMKINVRYTDKTYLSGEISLSNSYFILQNNRFNITSGIMKIIDSDRIFINMEAIGTQSLSSTRIYVYGYVPDYKITIYDTKQSTDTYFNASRSTGSQTLISKIINDTAFKEIVKATDRFFGINRIGIEPSSNGGVFKIGRTFNDRVEVNFTANIDETRANKLSGEYTLFDWFKLNIFSTSRGGTGAGIIFNFDF
jgi:hypothetical protein